jgi:dTDP-4-amino-4,6-dideoxygalactose transaminase
MDRTPSLGNRVPYHRPSIGAAEIREVVRTLRSGWLTTGPRTAQFEQEFREYVRTSCALAVSSCTGGLHLALAGLKIGPGMEVITTPLTFCATVNVILHLGAKPVLADVGSDGNIDPSSIAARITERTKAIVPVHFAGLPCEMQAIWDLARRHRLHVIEDAAHAVGSHYRGLPIGSGDPHTGAHSDVSVFSFYATKNMTTGEGGMVATQDEQLADCLRVLCLHGISKNAWNRYTDQGSWYYQVLQPGFKYNLTDIQSAIGIHQLRRLESFIETRTQYAHAYNQAFADVEELETPPDKNYCRHSWYLYALRLNLEKLEIKRDEFILELKERGIGTSVHFIPIPLHPFFAAFAQQPENQCPQALALYPRMISLPLYPTMTEAQIKYVAESAKDIVHRTRKDRSVFVTAPPTSENFAANQT